MTSHKAFTFIELLVVVGIIAILSIVVVAVLNPAESLRQGRDAARISDMSTLDGAIDLYNSDQAGAATYSIGSANTIYISIPDPSATSTAGDQCQGLGLPSLPTTYTYHCAASSTYRKTDGTGWIPINFANSTTAGAAINKLSVDPTNTSSTHLYYTYTTDGVQYETTAPMESSKFKPGGKNDQITNDGGKLAATFEKGTTFGLEPLDYGDTSLVGYWRMDEGAGSSTYDSSGYNSTGTWNGTAAGTSGYYSAGKVGPWAGAFDGATTYININTSTSQSFGTNAITICAWVNLQNWNSGVSIFNWRPVANNAGVTLEGAGSNSLNWYVNNGSWKVETTASWPVSTWVFVAAVYDGANLHTYRNGVEVGTPVSVTGNIAPPSSPFIEIGKNIPGAIYVNGLIDNVRVYNRALSAAEILNLYNGGK